MAKDFWEQFNQGSVDGIPTPKTLDELRTTIDSRANMGGAFNVFDEDQAYVVCNLIAAKFPHISTSVRDCQTSDGCYQIGYRARSLEAVA